jgi:hypothetical protein
MISQVMRCLGGGVRETSTVRQIFLHFIFILFIFLVDIISLSMSASESVGSSSEGSLSSSTVNNGPILTTVPSPSISSSSSTSSSSTSGLPSSTASVVGSGGGKRSSTNNRNPSERILLSWCGDKHWLLIKEGVHILLDRILIKDTAHLVARSLYSRLSRTEKRAAVVRYASALLQVGF